MEVSFKDICGQSLTIKLPLKATVFDACKSLSKKIDTSQNIIFLVSLDDKGKQIFYQNGDSIFNILRNNHSYDYIIFMKCPKIDQKIHHHPRKNLIKGKSISRSFIRPNKEIVHIVRSLRKNCHYSRNSSSIHCDYCRVLNNVPRDLQSRINQIAQLGYQIEDIKEALRSSFYNVQHAIQILVNRNNNNNSRNNADENFRMGHSLRQLMFLDYMFEDNDEIIDYQDYIESRLSRSPNLPHNKPQRNEIPQRTGNPQRTESPQIIDDLQISGNPFIQFKSDDFFPDDDIDFFDTNSDDDSRLPANNNRKFTPQINQNKNSKFHNLEDHNHNRNSKSPPINSKSFKPHNQNKNSRFHNLDDFSDNDDSGGQSIRKRQILPNNNHKRWVQNPENPENPGRQRYQPPPPQNRPPPPQNRPPPPQIFPSPQKNEIPASEKPTGVNKPVIVQYNPKDQRPKIQVKVELPLHSPKNQPLFTFAKPKVDPSHSSPADQPLPPPLPSPKLEEEDDPEFEAQREVKSRKPMSTRRFRPKITRIDSDQ